MPPRTLYVLPSPCRIAAADSDHPAVAQVPLDDPQVGDAEAATASTDEADEPSLVAPQGYAHGQTKSLMPHPLLAHL